MSVFTAVGAGHDVTRTQGGVALSDA